MGRVLSPAQKATFYKFEAGTDLKQNEFDRSVEGDQFEVFDDAIRQTRKTKSTDSKWFAISQVRDEVEIARVSSAGVNDHLLNYDLTQ